MEALDKPQKMHLGRKISRIREIRGIKQEHLAQELGVSQQSISRIEQSEFVEDEVLAKVAKVLGVTSEAIKSFNEDSVINFFNNFNDSSSNNGAFYANNCTFNPLDKVVELYERLLQSEREKIEILKGNK
ncbi:helix-turn-helix transcriptional regulator [Desertivirga arenae]|uniref:helix-turn-helix transcriptional regulator n=1 Tax=Desertivirga arenae TaxID=2810309 RepID=UPI001A957EB3|nr:helix-turn-helix transcriptional regulator [Pedobacter sp. SYSU D00823]